MLNKESGAGLALAVLFRRAASDWRMVLWIIGGLSLAIVPAWFSVFHESSPLSLSGRSQRLAEPAAFHPAAANTLPGRPAVAPAADAPLKPVQSIAEADRTTRALASAKAAAARGPGPGSASAFGPPRAAQDGGGGTRYQSMARSDSLTPLPTDKTAFAGRPVSVPLTAFSQQNKASREQLAEPVSMKDEPQVKMPGRAPASRGAHAEVSSGPGQPPASAAGLSSGQPIGGGPAQSAGGQTTQGGGAAAITGSGSGASAGGSGLTGLSGFPGGEAGLAALGGGGAAGASAGAGASAINIQAAMADGQKCSQSTAYYTPLVQKASNEMMSLNSQALSCGPTIRCSFASNSVCTEDADPERVWWKRYYAGMCACAKVHCQVNAKCQEVNSLSCQQLHACPMTATRPCQPSPCNY